MPLDPAALASAHAKLEQLRRQIDADVDALLADVVTSAAAEREAAVAAARADAQAESARTLAEELAAADVRAARAIADAVAATEAQAAETLGDTIAARDAASARAVEEAVAAAEARAANKLATALTATDGRTAQAVADAVAAAEARAAQKLAAAEEKAADTLVNALAAADERTARAIADAVAHTEAQAAERLREAVAVAEARVAHANAAAVAAAEERTARAVAEAVAAAEARAADAATLAELGVDVRVAAAVAETEERNAQAVAVAVAAAEQKGARALADALASARAQAVSDLATCVAEARADERYCELACLDQMMQATRQLDGAISLSHVLDRLTDAAARIALGRVALLVVRDGALRGWKLVGFGDHLGEASHVTVPLDRPTVASRAVETGEPATTRDGGEILPLPFASLPDGRVGMALPLRVGGRTVAVLYADDLGATTPSVPNPWPEALEILTRHAGRSLELLTLSRACGSISESRSEPATVVMTGVTPEQEESARRYARLLVSEIKLYHEDAVNAGRRDANLLERLGPEILRARRLYEERVPAVVRGHADYFDGELVRTLANGDRRLLGQGT
jgi:hypothetical protein